MRREEVRGEIRGLNEECGIFAIADNKNAMAMTYYGLHSLQHRGQEAGGIAFRDGDKLDMIKGKGLITEVFSEINVGEIETNDAIGHVRYSSAGGLGLVNVQPFIFRFFDETISLAHNGFIGNAKMLREDLEQKGSVFSSMCDGEILVHLLRLRKGTFLERLLNSLPVLEGAFAFVLMHDSGIYGTRDKYGLRPLSIGQLEDGSYVLSSETCAFNVIGAKFVRDVEPGEVVKIDGKKLESMFYSTQTSHNLCLMEYVYFSRPDSSLDGTNVHFARKQSGRFLAQEAGIEGDIVVGVPDSSTSAAIGYAEETGIPYEMGLIKNRYIGRTFIQPTQELREKGVRMKLSAVSEIVKDKRVILIDDSIVRGTTSKRIITLLKEAGAKEVHVRIASPAIKFPCYYGVDISTYEELISNKYNVEELCEIIKADSLAFLSLEGLENAILSTKYHDNEKHKSRYCTACFNKNYVSNLYGAIEDINIEE